MQCLIFQMHEKYMYHKCGGGGGGGGRGGSSEFIGNQGVQLEKLQWFRWS